MVVKKKPQKEKSLIKRLNFIKDFSFLIVRGKLLKSLAPVNVDDLRPDSELTLGSLIIDCLPLVPILWSMSWYLLC